MYHTHICTPVRGNYYRLVHDLSTNESVSVGNELEERLQCALVHDNLDYAALFACEKQKVCLLGYGPGPGTAVL